jgi:hypothetical protein
MSYNMIIGYDIYGCFTMEHFRLRQRMTLTTKIYCSYCTLKFSFSKIIIYDNNRWQQTFYTNCN